MDIRLSKRRFLSLAVQGAALMGITSVPLVRADEEFERYKNEMNTGWLGSQDEFAQYKQDYDAAYADYHQEIAQFWTSPELSDQTLWVDYNPDMDIKRVVDFDKDEIRISVRGKALENFRPEDAERQIRETLGTSISKAYLEDPLLKKVTGDKPPKVPQNLLGLSPHLASTLNSKSKITRKAGKAGDVLTITAPLPANALSQRAGVYLPMVKKAAAKWQVPASLVMAIMHTESAFNPMARSHIPAFGLMQIVPKSAGRDASKLVFGKERLLTGRDLYQPATNIEMGAAYLHILDKKYLSGIKDPAARLHCVIAAYNTGAGNVARAFSGTTSIKKALPLINRLSAQQVYAHLRSNLKYKEARNYVQKVNKHLATYRTA